MSEFVLVRMRQLAEAQSEDDDWTGLKDQAERRKRQTRLSLRAHRKSHPKLLIGKKNMPWAPSWLYTWCLAGNVDCV
jgi:hypothetical protein